MGTQLDLDDVAVTSDLAVQELLEMRAELEAARVDAERLDWLESFVNATDGIVLHNGGYKFNEHDLGYVGLGLANTGRTLRAAIDAARGKDNG